MGTNQIEQFAYKQLQPAQYPWDARLEAVRFGPSLTIPAGCAVALKNTDNNIYPLFNTGGSNEVQTVAVDTIMSAGQIGIYAVDSSGVGHQVNVAYTASWTATVAAIQTALIAVLGTSAVACAVTNTHDMTITFSGAGYAGIAQSPVVVDITGATGPTKVAVTRTTPGGTSDGTQLFKGWNQYDLQTDSSSNVYFMSNGTAGPSYRQSPRPNAPIFTEGVFDPQDLRTRATPTAEVDTFTPANPTTGDVYTLTINYSNLVYTHTVSATVGATQTATAICALLIAAWNADSTAASYATATGTTTLVLTSVVPGNILNITASVVGTGTMSKAITTVTNGRAIADILAGRPGAYVQANGFWKT